MASKPFEPAGTTLTITPDGDDATDFTLEYITIQPPAWEGGEPIDTTTLSNTKFKTKMAQILIEIGEMSFTAEYDPKTVASAPINKPGTITLAIPKIGTWTLRGHLRSITPDNMEMGNRATCSGSIAITCTGADGAAETDPTWQDAVAETETPPGTQE